MIRKKQVYRTLQNIMNNDCYLEQFLDGDIKEDILKAFYINNLIWISDNDRILITDHGEQCLHRYDLER